MLKKLLLTCWLLTAPALADSLLQTEGGLRARIPDGYTVRDNVAVDPTGNSMVVFKTHAYANFDAFAADANLARDGFRLEGEVRALNATDRAFRAVRGDGLVADTIVRFAPGGGGSLVVSLAPRAAADASFQAALGMPVEIGASQWEPALRNKHLLFLQTGNGYSERVDLYLLADGRFAYRHDSSSLSANGTGAVAGGTQGTWRVVGETLVLQFQQGGQRTYTLARRASAQEISLNGARYFVLSE